MAVPGCGVFLCLNFLFDCRLQYKQLNVPPLIAAQQCGEEKKKKQKSSFKSHCLVCLLWAAGSFQGNKAFDIWGNAKCFQHELAPIMVHMSHTGIFSLLKTRCWGRHSRTTTVFVFLRLHLRRRWSGWSQPCRSSRLRGSFSTRKLRPTKLIRPWQYVSLGHLLSNQTEQYWQSQTGWTKNKILYECDMTKLSKPLV